MNEAKEFFAAGLAFFTTGEGQNKYISSVKDKLEKSSITLPDDTLKVMCETYVNNVASFLTSAAVNFDYFLEKLKQKEPKFLEKSGLTENSTVSEIFRKGVYSTCAKQEMLRSLMVSLTCFVPEGKVFPDETMLDDWGCFLEAAADAYVTLLEERDLFAKYENNEFSEELLYALDYFKECCPDMRGKVSYLDSGFNLISNEQITRPRISNKLMVDGEARRLLSTMDFKNNLESRIDYVFLSVSAPEILENTKKTFMRHMRSVPESSLAKKITPEIFEEKWWEKSWEDAMSTALLSMLTAEYMYETGGIESKSLQAVMEEGRDISLEGMDNFGCLMHGAVAILDLRGLTKPSREMLNFFDNNTRHTEIVKFALLCAIKESWHNAIIASHALAYMEKGMIARAAANLPVNVKERLDELMTARERVIQTMFDARDSFGEEGR